MQPARSDGASSCIEACNDCNRVCLQHVQHCLTLGGEHAEADHIAMLLTCASVCRATAELVALDSEWHATMCDLCSQVCEECADGCEELGEMDDCVQACQRCAEECRAMVAVEDDDADADEDADDELEVSSERIN